MGDGAASREREDAEAFYEFLEPFRLGGAIAIHAGRGAYLMLRECVPHAIFPRCGWFGVWPWSVIEVTPSRDVPDDAMEVEAAAPNRPMTRRVFRFAMARAK